MDKKPTTFLSNKEKTLLYLLEHGALEHPHIVFTQEAIVKAIGINQPHTSRVLIELIKKVFVKKESAYIREKNRNMKIYYLTKNGELKAEELKNKILKEKIILKDKDGFSKEMEISRVNSYLRKNQNIILSIVEIIENLSENTLICEGLKEKIIIQREQRKILKSYSNKYLKNIYTNGFFYGRDKELQQLRECIFKSKPNIITVYGPAGIGKTKLVSKLILEYKEKKIFFHKILEWNTIKSILIIFSEFLSQIGKKKLKNYLKSKETIDLNEVMYILKEDLRNINGLFVFDDCQKTSNETIQLFSLLKEVVIETEKITLLLISRSKLQFYKFAEVIVDKLISEIELGDLEKTSSIEYLRNKGVDESLFVKIYEITKEDFD